MTLPNLTQSDEKVLTLGDYGSARHIIKDFDLVVSIYKVFLILEMFQ